MVFILTGPVHSGKTGLLKEAVRQWVENGRRIGGFLSEAAYREGIPVAYDLVELPKQTRIPFLARRGRHGWPRSGPYFFIPGALDTARSLIAGAREYDLCVVDEVGPLELRGEGLWPALENMIFEPGLNWLLVVRRGILREFITRLGRKGRNLRRPENRSQAESTSHACDRQGQTCTFDIISLRRQSGLNDAGQEENIKCAGLTPIVDRLTQEIFGRRKG